MRGSLRSAVEPVPETDFAVASQFSYMKVFASGGSFPDVCDELIGMGQNRPVKRPLSLLAFCGGEFRYPTDTLSRAVTLRRSPLTDCWQ